MLCNNCNKNKATINLIKKTKGKNKSFMLCDKCAMDIMSLTLEDEDKRLEDFICDLNKYIDSVEKKTKEDLICKKCKMSFRDFEEGKVLGCDECYKVFKKDILAFLGVKHSNIKYRGKHPKSLEKEIKTLDLRILEEKLKINILKEDYEEAAITNKEILSLKRKLKEE